MRLAKIKNSYMFKSNNPNGVHTYAVYYDFKNKRYNAVQLTHLYVKDDKRFNQVNKGNILVEKFSQFEVPSGVRNVYYNKNIKGGKIDLQDKNITYIDKNHLSKTKASKIKNFAKYLYK